MNCFYLMRHGAAAADVKPDSDRPLTETGALEVAACANRFYQRQQQATWPAVSRITSSPLLRAQQTAKIMASDLGWPGQLLIDPCLVPQSSPQAAERSLQQAESGLLLVSHQPLLRAMINYLCDENVYQDTGWLVVLEGEYFGQGLCRLIEVIKPP